MFEKINISRVERPGDSAEESQTSSCLCMWGEGSAVIHRIIQFGRNLGRWSGPVSCSKQDLLWGQTVVLGILFSLVLKVSKHGDSAGFGQTAPLLSCPQGVKVFSDIQDSKQFWFAAGLSLAELCENSWCPVLIWAVIIQPCFVFGLAAPCSGMALRGWVCASHSALVDEHWHSSAEWIELVAIISSVN